jgi:2-polyprenyl-3-methyl-5-hydroxy-6-metoxy-1,4-benzoquinol methylase
VTARDDVGTPEGAEIDDWDHHWDSYGEAAEGNPANDYRRSLVRKLLGRPPAGSVVLDIGSGQGVLAIHVRELYPDVAVRGVEYSASGVRRSRAVAAARGVEVTFTQRDLLEPVTLEPGEPAATHAICSEVLEHVDDPARLLRNAINLLAPGARVVVTVPGGPRSAFDKHIGHRTHYTADRLHGVLTDGGLQVERVLRAGFPFFNLYKLAVILRGRRLIADVGSRPAGAAPSRAETIVINAFRKGFAVNRDDFPFGWQMAAVARVPASGEAAPSS